MKWNIVELHFGYQVPMIHQASSHPPMTSVIAPGYPQMAPKSVRSYDFICVKSDEPWIRKGLLSQFSLFQLKLQLFYLRARVEG